MESSDSTTEQPSDPCACFSDDEVGSNGMPRLTFECPVLEAMDCGRYTKCAVDEGEGQIDEPCADSIEEANLVAVACALELLTERTPGHFRDELSVNDGFASLTSTFVIYEDGTMFTWNTDEVDLDGTNSPVRHIEAPAVESIEACAALESPAEQWQCVIDAIAASAEIAVCTDETYVNYND